MSKRIQKGRERIDKDKRYPVNEAVDLLRELALAEETKVKFTESFDVSINLGVDPKKADQVVRSSTVLPHGTGKTIRVAVFAEGDAAEQAKAAGADKVGFEDLAEEVKAGKMDFDVVIASPDAMRFVGKLGQILGPRGLMPNPKVGTVTPNVAEAVKKAKAGQVRYRTDKAGIIHSTIGTVNFAADDLLANLTALMTDLKKLKPSSAKGVYFKKVTLTTTMGPGVVVDQATLAV